IYIHTPPSLMHSTNSIFLHIDTDTDSYTLPNSSLVQTQTHTDTHTHTHRDRQTDRQTDRASHRRLELPAFRFRYSPTHLSDFTEHCTSCDGGMGGGAPTNRHEGLGHSRQGQHQKSHT